MNCELDLPVLMQLLLYLSGQFPSRDIIIHSTVPSAVVQIQAAASNTSASLLLSFSSDAAKPTTHTVHLFLPGFVETKIAFRRNRFIFRSVFVYVEDKCHKVQVKMVPARGTSLLVDLTRQNSHINYKLLRKVPFTADQMSEVGNYRTETSGWQLYMPLITRIPLERNVLENKTMTLMISAAAHTNRSQAIYNFVRTSSAFYWQILIEFFRFRLDIRINEVADGQGFNQANRDIAKFSQARYDAMGVLLIIDSDRVDKLDFVPIGLQVKYHLIVRRPEYESSWLSLAKPLAPGSWISILFIVLAVAVTLSIIFRCAPRSPYKSSFCSTLFLVFGFACNQVNLKRLENISMQWACVTALFYFYIVNQFYVSNLYGILATKEITYPFESLEEFLEKNTHMLVMSPDTSIYSAFIRAESGIEYKIANQYVRGHPRHKLTGATMRQQLQRVCHGEAAIFALPMQMAGYSTRECPLQFVPQGYYPMLMALAVRTNHPYLGLFRQLYHRAIESGVSNYMKHKYAGKVMKAISKRNTATSLTPIDLYQVLFPMSVLVVGAGLSVLLLILEIIWQEPRLLLKFMNQCIFWRHCPYSHSSKP